MKIPKLIRHPLRRYLNKLRTWLLTRKCRHLVRQLLPVINQLQNSVPVIIISYNNSSYVQNISTQLNQYNIKPIIIDNNSTSDKSMSILTGLEQTGSAYIIRSHHNFGHLVGFMQPVYDILPDVFCYTDPDLQFNKNLPMNFIETLTKLTLEFPVYKAGFALAIKGCGPLKDTIFHSSHFKPFFYEKNLTIEEFESKYWVNKLQHNKLELYAASIDTTFALYRKTNYFGDFYNAIRVAGDYSAIHLPWFKELDPLSDEDRKTYKKFNKSSNWV